MAAAAAVYDDATTRSYVANDANAGHRDTG